MMHPHDSLASLAYSDSKHPPESGRDIQFPGNGGLVLSATQFGDPKSPQVLLLHGGGKARHACAYLLYTSPSHRDRTRDRMQASA